MKRAALGISVPEPCHENWDQMRPSVHGRYCAACTKTVIDFTGMTDAEIIAALRGPGRVCGRFSPGQLQRPLSPHRAQHHSSWLAAVIMSAITLLGRPHQSAAAPPAQTEVFIKQAAAMPGPEIKKSPRKITITLLDSETHQPAEAAVARLYFNNRKIGVYTPDSCGTIIILSEYTDSLELKIDGFSYSKITLDISTFPPDTFTVYLNSLPVTVKPSPPAVGGRAYLEHVPEQLFPVETQPVPIPPREKTRFSIFRVIKGLD